MKIALIGGVSSTLVTLKMLYKHNYDSVDVYGYEPSDKKNVSCYNELKDDAGRCGYKYYGFKKINDYSDSIIKESYDFIFVVGLSQLVSDKIILSAKQACIGFHPTKLPKGRGRAPIAWLILEGVTESAVTFFRINPESGADSGEIIEQIEYKIDKENDTVSEIEQKILAGIENALHILLPKLKKGKYTLSEQDESLFTEYGLRKPDDGYIDWSKDCEYIRSHIRSSMPPHPGAYAFIDTESFEVKISEKEAIQNIKGVIGRVLKVQGDHYLIQTGDGCIWIQTSKKLKVGCQLGVYRPYEIYQINNRIKNLEEKIDTIIKKYIV